MNALRARDLTANGISRDRALTVLTRSPMPWRWANGRDYTNMVKRVSYGQWARNVPTLLTSWTGKVLRVSHERESSDLLHELCHWLVAPASRRRLPEFGLGKAPWPDIVDQERDGIYEVLVDYHDREYDEFLAAALDVYLHRLLGGHWLQRAAYDLNLCDYRASRDHGPHKGRPTTWQQFIATDDYQTEPRLSTCNLWDELDARGCRRAVEALCASA